MSRSDAGAADRGGRTWADETPMSAFETSMWRAEVDPALSMTAMVGEQLDTVPDWDRFVAAHEWATRMAPRFRQKVVEDPFGLGRPRWTTDPAFDLGYHVRRHRLPDGGGWPALYEAVAQVGMTPLDRSRSPWEAVLFDGLPDGRSLYLLKLHHATTDGMGAMGLLSDLHSRQRQHDPDKPWPEVDHEGGLTPLGALRRHLREEVAAGPAVATRLGSATLRSLTDPIGTARRSAAYAASMRRVVPAAAPGSPLLSARSRSWRLAALDVPFADLRAAGKAVGGTLNDAYLAGLFGGFARYHRDLGVTDVAAVPTTVPVSLRRPGEGGGGNGITTIQIAGPLLEPDPARRVAAVRDLVRAARDEPAVDVIGALSPVVARLPGTLIAALSGSIAKGNDLQASNVPGVPDGAHLAGARVERMYGFGPLPGCAVMAVLVTLGEVACVGVTVDAASVTDPDRFFDCIAEGFDEVLALHPGSAPTERRR